MPRVPLFLAVAGTWSSTHGLLTAVDAEYEAFRQQFGRAEISDAEEYSQRAQLFQRRRAEVEAQNAAAGASWKAVMNRFADYTDLEKRAMLGYVRSGDRWASASAGGAATASFLEVRQHRALAESVDWRRLNSSAFLREQGACGSCWAVASVGALEMHAELQQSPARQLSYEQLVDCVPNPKECGGQGGCKGATAELAFEYVQKNGLAAAEDYKGYQSGGDGRCKPAKQSTSIRSFERLPENKLRPLMEAVATKGPVVVSVDASQWSAYGSGVFDGCHKDATVNHAVLLVGYGVDRESGKKYWLIRNSWGEGWGENGYIRLLRHDSDEGAAGYCGTDYNPLEGVGCKGGPKQIPVCGMCGVLSDSSYPKEVHGTA